MGKRRRLAGGGLSKLSGFEAEEERLFYFLEFWFMHLSH
jgi:hypothetical protein